MITMIPVLKEEFVDEPPLTGSPLLGLAELHPGTYRISIPRAQGS